MDVYRPSITKKALHRVTRVQGHGMTYAFAALEFKAAIPERQASRLTCCQLQTEKNKPVRLCHARRVTLPSTDQRQSHAIPQWSAPGAKRRNPAQGRIAT